MRRILIIAITLLVSLPLAAQSTTPVTPERLWEALMAGNKEFVAGKITYDQLKEEREHLADHQMPPITVLACSDSRVPPELIFNQSLGGLFVVRAAGNVVDDFGIASIEYAIAMGYTTLIVVLGHESCGAVVASLGGADPSTPALTALAMRIRSSFVGIPYDSKDPKIVQRAVELNARAASASLLARSKLIRDAVLTERVKIVTADYNLHTGVVKKID